MRDRHIVALSRHAIIVSSDIHLQLSDIPLSVVVRRSLRMLLTIRGSRLGADTIGGVRLFPAEIHVPSRISLRVALVIGLDHVDSP